MRTIDDLLHEAKYGQLTREEISYVAQKIKESTPDDDLDLYGLIFILGLSGAKEYRDLLERFLYYPSDPMVAGMALKGLCTYWNEAQNYLHLIKTFIRGVDWDTDDDVRLAAMHCAREFLSQTPEKELLVLLLNIYNESNSPLWREVTFEALAFAVGKTIKDFVAPPGSKKTYLDEKFINSVIKQVVQLIESLD